MNRVKAQKLFEASLWGGADLITELKKIRGGKYRHELPETVAGANGETEVCEKFREIYETCTRNLYLYL